MWHTPVLQFDKMGPLASKIESMGLSFTDDQLRTIIERLREIVKKKTAASDEEMEEIIKEVIL